jgi:hypothetical protein
MPPQHSATATIRVIASTDPAWDHERIELEYAELGKAGLGHTHPYMQYVIGGTRFDLDAPVQWKEGTATPKSYLRSDARPLTWVMRRLRTLELAQCDDVGGREGDLAAFRRALVGIENPPDGLTVPQFNGSQPMLEAVVDGIVEVVGADAVFAAGHAARRASAAPTNAEKKP